MINLTMNDSAVEVEEGKSLLEAAKLAGIEIPTLCYSPAVPAAGACRICVVEVTGGGRPGLVASCAHPAQEGLEVQTDSQRVRESRRMTLELLLARSPNAEILQKMAEEYGAGNLPLVKKNEDCIMCGLCVRVCQQVIGQKRLQTRILLL